MTRNHQQKSAEGRASLLFWKAVLNYGVFRRVNTDSREENASKQQTTALVLNNQN
jgi:hypothetical protein